MVAVVLMVLLVVMELVLAELQLEVELVQEEQTPVVEVLAMIINTKTIVVVAILVMTLV